MVGASVLVDSALSAESFPVVVVVEPSSLDVVSGEESTVKTLRDWQSWCPIKRE